MPDLSPDQWMLAGLGAVSMGISKAGFNAMSLVHVLIFALVFGARASTGLILPMLIVADILAVRAFRAHARWEYIRRMLPPTLLGVGAGFLLMGRLDDATFKTTLGGIVLILAAMQGTRLLYPGWLGNVPHSRAFAWTMGIMAGVATMLANAAGPIFTIYALSVALPKFALVGTGAWFFFIVNVSKLPFSAALGLIDRQTLLVNLALVPLVVIGLVVGRQLTERVPQKLFDGLLLGSAVLAALRLMGML